MARKTGSARSGTIGRFIRRALLVFVLIPIAYAGIFLVYPNVAALKVNNPETTSFMRYREREWREKGVSRTITRTWVPLSRISPNAAKAVVISEDDKFWTHEGFDFQAMEKAAKKNLKQKRFRVGGSTISQQLAKNLYLTPEKKIVRKVKEAILTWRIEHTLSKRRILELYLNVVEWGDGIFGIEAASRSYFHKPASALTAREAARLAAALPNPRRIHPDSGSQYVERRAEQILAVMMKRGEAIEGIDGMMREEKPVPKTNVPESDSVHTKE